MTPLYIATVYQSFGSDSSLNSMASQEEAKEEDVNDDMDTQSAISWLSDDPPQSSPPRLVIEIVDITTLPYTNSSIAKLLLQVGKLPVGVYQHHYKDIVINAHREASHFNMDASQLTKDSRLDVSFILQHVWTVFYPRVARVFSPEPLILHHAYLLFTSFLGRLILDPKVATTWKDMLISCWNETHISSQQKPKLLRKRFLKGLLQEQVTFSDLLENYTDGVVMLRPHKFILNLAFACYWLAVKYTDDKGHSLDIYVKALGPQLFGLAHEAQLKAELAVWDRVVVTFNGFNMVPYATSLLLHTTCRLMQLLPEFANEVDLRERCLRYYEDHLRFSWISLYWYAKYPLGACR